MLMDTITYATGATAPVKQAGGSFLTGSLYEIAGSTLSQPTNAAVLMRFSVNRAIVMPAGLTNSYAESTVAATGSTVYSIKKNGSEVGTMTFAASGTIATFAMASQTSFAIGDILTVVAPASADATHTDIAWTLTATIA